ncbi:hypothetical protein Acr_02g0000130 [Actinidia rufa]|uniref:C2 NT-type domain-containing protein n=1 Tax=Actinidia rufa TaxID=165716 RepID=A0A7J0E5I6_9ERIC|nr:hypothetical protein Acr_02g0000130 [Actinidia rufa]
MLFSVSVYLNSIHSVSTVSALGGHLPSFGCDHRCSTVVHGPHLLSLSIGFWCLTGVLSVKPEKSVPKGWDKLYVSLLSSETGKKTISKSGKATVRNGTCKWTETLSETIWISKDEASKDLQQYFFKLVVVMGSARSSILGEATINMAGYMSSRASAPVSLPLKKCNDGTILQVEIQCLTPRINGRDEKMNPTNSYVEDANSDYDDVDNRSEVSDCTFTKSVGSFSSNHLDDTFHPGDQGSRCLHLLTEVPCTHPTGVRRKVYQFASCRGFISPLLCAQLERSPPLIKSQAKETRFGVAAPVAVKLFKMTWSPSSELLSGHPALVAPFVSGQTSVHIPKYLPALLYLSGSSKYHYGSSRYPCTCFAYLCAMVTSLVYSSR